MKEVRQLLRIILGESILLCIFAQSRREDCDFVDLLHADFYRAVYKSLAILGVDVVTVERVQGVRSRDTIELGNFFVCWVLVDWDCNAELLVFIDEGGRKRWWCALVVGLHVDIGVEADVGEVRIMEGVSNRREMPLEVESDGGKQWT